MTEFSNDIRASNILAQVAMRIGGPEDARLYAHQVADLYESDFFDQPLQEGRTDVLSKARLQTRLVDEHATEPNFRLVTLWAENDIVGFAYGSSLVPGTLWWKSVIEPLSEEFVEENGRRTLALFYFLVRKELRGHGLAGRLHRGILQERAEERVTLLSATTQQPAHSICEVPEGFRTAGRLPSYAASFRANHSDSTSLGVR